MITVLSAIFGGFIVALIGKSTADKNMKFKYVVEKRELLKQNIREIVQELNKKKFEIKKYREALKLYLSHEEEMEIFFTKDKEKILNNLQELIENDSEISKWEASNKIWSWEMLTVAFFINILFLAYVEDLHYFLNTYIPFAIEDKILRFFFLSTQTIIIFYFGKKFYFDYTLKKFPKHFKLMIWFLAELIFLINLYRIIMFKYYVFVEIIVTVLSFAYILIFWGWKLEEVFSKNKLFKKYSLTFNTKTEKIICIIYFIFHFAFLFCGKYLLTIRN
ncbi:MAG: hypothetical protein ACRCSK_03385 [Fusobacteriaceae bacterium]